MSQDPRAVLPNAVGAQITPMSWARVCVTASSCAGNNVPLKLDVERLPCNALVLDLRGDPMNAQEIQCFLEAASWQADIRWEILST
jgi:hypothetical protein